MVANMSITIPCANPQCRKSTFKMLSELEVSDNVVCPRCGTVTDLTSEMWQAALRKARQAAEEIEPKPG